MKLTNIVCVLAVSALAITACQKKVKLDTDIQKASYAIGQQIGNNIKGQQLDLDVEVLAESIKQAAKGDKALLTPEQMQEAMKKLQEMAIKKQTESAEKNKADGTAFLEKNKTAEGVKTTASGLQYQVLKEGSGKKPAKNSKVKVHYSGTLINGEKFDSSYDRNEPAEFPLDQVIPGWTEGLQLMTVGSKYKFFIPSDLAYGPQGRPSIPPNSTLIFEVELLEVN